jgi:hypothetical protein
MADLITIIFDQLDKLLPMQYRVRIVSCAALVGLLAFGFWSIRNFSTKDDVQQSVLTAIAPLTATIAAVQNTATLDRNRFDSSLNFLSQQSIEAAITAKVKLRCLSSSGDQRVDLTDDIQRLEDKYFTLTHGQGYPQPTCYEAGVDTKQGQ